MGPLKGIRVVELAGIGPVPFAAMLLADMGADVLRVDRATATDVRIPVPSRFDILNRNKRSITVDLKSQSGVDTVLKVVSKADILIEGFRPGVTERLGLGPDACLRVNPRLVYGRMTGWGQEGPLAQTAGHDLNYIALSGALHAIGPSATPAVPLNLIGDFGGGALYLAMGLLAACIEASKSGKGQVVDAAIIDGVASMMSIPAALRQLGAWTLGREENLLDGGAPFYRVYETRDARFVAVAAIEGRFYQELIKRMRLADEKLPDQNDRQHWPAMCARFASVFRTRTRDEWTKIMADSDACVTPVMDMDEALTHPQATARSIYCSVQGVMQPAPAPRFSRTPGTLRLTPPEPGHGGADALRDWGFAQEEIAQLFPT